MACLLVDLGGRPILQYLALVFPFLVLYHPVLVSNGTLIISMPWIIVKSLGSSFNDLLKTLKLILTTSPCLFSLTQGSPPPPNLDFGLCARVFSAVFLPLEPTIEFSHSPAVSPSKSRDFRLPEPTIPFYPWSAVSPSKSRDFRLPEPTIPFYYWSAVSPHHVTSDVTRPIRSQSGGHLSALYYYNSLKATFFFLEIKTA